MPAVSNVASRSRSVAFILILGGLLLTEAGCTAQKARAIRTAAVQFQAEAEAAIGAMDRAMQKELAPPERSRTEADEDFVNALLSIPGEAVTESVFERAIERYAIGDADERRKKREAFLGDLHRPYIQFAQMFEDLEKGSHFAAGAVREAGPIAERLTIQMAGLAKAWAEAPPRLLQQRSLVLVATEDVLDAEGLTADQKRRRLLELKERWLAIRDEEQLLLRNIVEGCLKAATIGRQISRLIREYDRLDLGTVQSYVTMALTASGQVSGRDLSNAQRGADEFFETIRADPIWNDLADVALEEMNQRLEEGRSSRTGEMPEPGFTRGG